MADLSLFELKITAKDVPSPVVDGRYDLNGNGSIDYRDVKIAQQFFGFLDGDATLDMTVNFDDLLALAANYNDSASPKRWIEGDFTGDQLVNFDDLLVLAANYNQSAPGGIALLQSSGTVTVPEPAAAAAVASLSLLTVRKRSKRRERLLARSANRCEHGRWSMRSRVQSRTSAPHRRNKDDRFDRRLASTGEPAMGLCDE